MILTDVWMLLYADEVLLRKRGVSRRRVWLPRDEELLAALAVQDGEERPRLRVALHSSGQLLATSDTESSLSSAAWTSPAENKDPSFSASAFECLSGIEEPLEVDAFPYPLLPVMERDFDDAGRELFDTWRFCSQL